MIARDGGKDQLIRRIWRDPNGFLQFSSNGERPIIGANMKQMRVK